MTDGADPLDPADPHGDDPLIEVLMRLARADFEARAPRTYDGGRRDTLAYLINTVSEELARVVAGLKQHEENLESSVGVLSDVLASHAAGDFSARAPRTDDGTPLDVLAFIINNTGAETGRLFEERNRAFQELQQAKETEAIARARSAFLANVSHELRTPLTLILGPLQSVLGRHRSELGAPVVDEIHTVLRNASRLSRMVNDLLDFTRAEEGKTRPVWQWTDVEEMVVGTVKDLQPLARDRGLLLEAAVVGTPREVPLDRRMFEKIVVNLVGNALKFTPKGGSVRASVEFTEDAIRLAVSDTGIGIPPEQSERVFDRFHQVDTSQSRRFEGSGLGLALVREFAIAMGGQAEVDSAVGKGSTFTVILPTGEVGDRDILPSEADGAPLHRQLAESAVAEVESRSAVAPVVAAPTTTGPRAFVLVAEDNPDMQRYICRVLEPHFEIEAVGDGAEALEAARGRVPDVILSDVMMPNMDGFELARMAKSDPALASVPIVLLTARAGSDASVEGLDAGADDYLAKPFLPRELVARVRAAARLRATGKHLEQTLDELQVTKSLVLRMGQVDTASGILFEVGQRLRAALQSNDVGSLAGLAEELTRLGEPLAAADEEDGLVDMAELVRDLLGLPQQGDPGFSVDGPRVRVAEALSPVLDRLAIPRKGEAELRVVEEGGLELVTGAADVPAVSGPLPPRPRLSDLEFARAHLALLHRGIESRLSTREGRTILRLTPG